MSLCFVFCRRERLENKADFHAMARAVQTSTRPDRASRRIRHGRSAARHISVPKRLAANSNAAIQPRSSRAVSIGLKVFWRRERRESKADFRAIPRTVQTSTGAVRAKIQRRYRGAQQPKNGAGTRNRTPDLLITSQLLYQLSYAGNFFYSFFRKAFYSRPSAFKRGRKYYCLRPRLASTGSGSG